MDKPSSFSAIHMLDALILLGLSLLGGAVSFVQAWRAGRYPAFHFMAFVGEIMTAGFAGLMAFFLCKSIGADGWTLAVASGMSGYMGTRALALIESTLAHRMGLHLPPSSSMTQDKKDQG